MPGRGSDRTPGPLFANLLNAGEGDGGMEPQSGDAQLPPPSVPEPGSDQPIPDSEALPQDEPPDASPPASDAARGAGEESLDWRGGEYRGATPSGRYGLLVHSNRYPTASSSRASSTVPVWIYDAHPAYTRAAASRSLGYHTALAVALSLAPLTVEPAGEHAFITQFLARWGSTSSTTRRPARRRRVKKSE